MKDMIRTVEKAADRAKASREMLELTIRAAHGGGLSLRAIAMAARMSHEQIRRIVSR